MNQPNETIRAKIRINSAILPFFRHLSATVFPLTRAIVGAHGVMPRCAQQRNDFSG
jgi:hypothetical protein